MYFRVVCPKTLTKVSLGQFQLSHGVGDVKALDFGACLPQLPGDGTPLLGLEAIAQLMAK